MNCTLIERVRCIHSEAKFSNHYWGDEFYTEVHVLNLTPTTTLNYEVQDKTLFGNNVKYDYLRVFSRKAFVYTLQKNIN